jgi:hypothetical protein
VTDIEKRLKTLEKRAQIDDQRWQMLDAQMTAFDLIFKAIGRSIGAANQATLQATIMNLRTYEDVARMQNEHSVMIRHLRETRLFFESLVKGNTSGGRTLTNDRTPPHEK